MLAVVWHHTRPSGPGLAIAGNAFLGVDVFFVLSGLLITALLLRERQSYGEVSLRAFYWRRFLRIFPLYYSIVGLLTVYYCLSQSATQGSAFLNELPTNLLFLSNWLPTSTVMAVGWSLSTEEQFYLAWPPLVAVFGRRSFWFLVVFLLVNQAVNYGLLALGDPKNITQVTFTPIVLGSMLAFGLSSGRVRPWIEAGTTDWRLYLALALAIMAASYPGDIQGTPRLCFHVLTVWVLAGIVTRPASVLVRLLEWRPLAYIGTVSYGVYLLHEIVLDRLVRGLSSLHLAAGWNFPLCATATVLVAHLSYKYFESPVLRFKDRRFSRDPDLVLAKTV